MKSPEEIKSRMDDIYHIVVDGREDENEKLSNLLSEYIELDHALEHYALSRRPS